MGAQEVSGQGDQRQRRRSARQHADDPLRPRPCRLRRANDNVRSSARVPPKNCRLTRGGLKFSCGCRPYYVAKYGAGSKAGAQAEPYYGRQAPPSRREFVVDLVDWTTSFSTRSSGGQSDWRGLPPPVAPLRLDEAAPRKYGVNKLQFWADWSCSQRSSQHRPRSVKGNRRLRRAINYAVDRAALRRVAGGPLAGTLADGYLAVGFLTFSRATSSTPSTCDTHRSSPWTSGRR